MAKKAKRKTTDGAASTGSSTVIDGSSLSDSATINDALAAAGAQDEQPASSPSASQAWDNLKSVSEAGSDKDDRDLPEVKVNKWSLHDLKMAADDAVRQYYSKPTLFNQSHRHTDIRLALGYTAGAIALSASGYAYKVGFQQSRQWVSLAVAVFAILSTLLALYMKYVEQDTIFEGRRKVFAGRIETQAIHVRSNCKPYTPVYEIAFDFTHSCNGGKSLIRQFKKEIKKPFGEFFDEEGVLRREYLEKDLQALLNEALAA